MDYGYDTIGYGFPTQDGGHTYGTKCNCPSCTRTRAEDAAAASAHAEWIKKSIEEYEANLDKGIVRDVTQWEGLGPDIITMHNLFGDKPIKLGNF